MSLQPSDHIKDTHLKSLLDVVSEKTQKQLTELRTKLKDDPKKLEARERDFLIRECAKLENLGSLQAKLDAYREERAGVKPGQRAKESLATNNSEKLGNHLRAVGQYRYNRKWQAHHIVCSRHGSHAGARLKLFAYLGLNDPHNGCWLPQKHMHARGTGSPNAVGHAYIHTDDYAGLVADHVNRARSKEALIDQLGKIRRKLLNATKSPDIIEVLTEKGKQDLRTSH